jgi:hypothetical protein
MNNSSGKYYVKNIASGTFQDITTLYDGVAVLSVTGLLDKGKPINIYTAQWVDEQEEDFLITTLDNQNNPVVIRENVDIALTFIVRKKYAASQSGFNVQTTHDNFVAYMTNSDVWIKSAYLGNKYVHCICLNEYKPTTIKLNRGDNSFIIGTITLHALNAPQS